MLTLLGINHSTAPVEIRERVNFQPEQMDTALQSVCGLEKCEGAALLSTCNRTEVYLDAETDGEALIQWLADWHHYDVDVIRQCHYFYQGDQAATHLMRVAAGLDSMVLGEPQIFGQLKAAYADAEKAGTLNSTLHQIFQHTFATAKHIRTETAIGENPVSIAYAAVMLSKQIFASLKDKTALLVGAGDTIALVGRHLKEQGVGRMIIANRTLERGRQLSEELDAESVLLSDIPDKLAEADITVTSTASQLPLLGKGAVETALRRRKHRMMFMIDLAVPRDIEPQVGELDDVYLFSVDDLYDVIEENRRSRELAANEAEDLVKVSVERLNRELVSRGNSDIIRRYRSTAEATMAAELSKAKQQLSAGTDAEEVLERLANNLTRKLIHHPTSELGRIAGKGDSDLTDLASRLLGIHENHSDN